MEITHGGSKNEKIMRNFTLYCSAAGGLYSKGTPHRNYPAGGT